MDASRRPRRRPRAGRTAGTKPGGPGRGERSVLAGLIGSGIQASRTPRLHEHEGAEQGLRYTSTGSSTSQRSGSAPRRCPSC